MRLNNVCCIGGNNIGAPACCVIAYNCPEVRVTVVDNEKTIAEWNSDIYPFNEPGLDEIIKKCRNRNLFFSSDYGSAIRDAELIFLSVNIPLKTKKPLQELEEAAKHIAIHSDSDKIVVEKTSVSARAADKIYKILHSINSGVRYQILYNPEFVTEGSIIQDLLNPKRVLIGCRNNPIGRAAAQSLCELYERWVPRKNIIILHNCSVEISKMATNAFLAQRITSINSLAMICEETGADISKISSILGKDSSIGSAYLDIAFGFGGFQNDISSLIFMCECLKLPEIASYWQSVMDLNEFQKKRFFSKIKSIIGTLNNEKITILGFSYKKNTSDTKNSPTIDLCKWLLKEKCYLQIYDPKVSAQQITKDLQLDFEEGSKTRTMICEDALSACNESSAIIICTDWDEFSALDYGILAKKAKQPRVIDGRKCLNENALKNTGMEYHAIGLSHVLKPYPNTSSSLSNRKIFECQFEEFVEEKIQFPPGSISMREKSKNPRMSTRGQTAPNSHSDPFL